MTTQDAFKKLDLAIGIGKDRVELKFNQLKNELNEKIRITSNEKLKGIFVSRLNEVETAYAFGISEKDLFRRANWNQILKSGLDESKDTYSIKRGKNIYTNSIVRKQNSNTLRYV